MRKPQQNTHRHPRSLLVAGLCGLVALFVCAGMFLLYRYTSEQTYQESVSQLEEISAQLFEKLDVQIEIQWGYLDKLAATLQQTETVTQEELSAVIAHC